MAEWIDQAGILGLSSVALLLLVYGRAWGSAVGLVGQFFWIRTAFRHGQPAVLILSVVYALIYGLGTIRWLKKRRLTTRAKKE